MPIGIAIFRVTSSTTRVPIYPGDTPEVLRIRSKLQSFKGVRVTYRYF